MAFIVFILFYLKKNHVIKKNLLDRSLEFGSDIERVEYSK